MPKLILSLPDSGEKTFDLTADVVTIGRAPDNDISIDDVSVSSHHAKLTRKDSTYEFEDLGSTNGSRVNGKDSTHAILELDDRLRFGKIEAQFVSAKKSESQPLPEVDDPSATLINTSTVPSDFSSNSNFKAKQKERDRFGGLLIGFSVLSILVFVAAIVRVFLLNPPQ